MRTYRNNQIEIYNSLSGKKEIFTPLLDGFVGMYVCGPTVYNKVHLGNIRTFISFDIVNRYFRHLDYKVRYVRNITDAGHLLDNEEDKISKQSILERIQPMEIVQKYTLYFHKVLDMCNLLPPDIEPTATGHIIEQIDLIRHLIDNDLAYESNNSVYFDVKKYNERKGNYGKLSGRNIDELIANTRQLDGQEEKKNPQDFALWKKAAPEHIMRWPSSWGVGFPGWHLECTAMSTKYLGHQFDIHGGGMDLKFPHHECEIAQAKGAYGEDPVRYWMHTNMLNLNGQKMSKSLGNFILPEQIFSGENEFFEKSFDSMVLKFFFLQAHYRSVLDLSNDALLATEKGLQRLTSAILKLHFINPSEKSTFDVQNWINLCYEAMNDDFNTPILISHLFEAVRYINNLELSNENLTLEDLELFKQAIFAFFYDILGLNIPSETSRNDLQLKQTVELIIDLRNKARMDKNWELSDEIRDRLAKVNIQLKDGKEGSSYIIE